MRRTSDLAGFIVTLMLCAACWWLWSADHGLTRFLGLEAMDMLVRVLSIFVLLSIVELVLARLGLKQAH